MSLVRSRQALEHFADQTANLAAHPFQPTQCDHQGFRDSDLPSRYFLKRSKVDISQNVKFLSGYFDRSRSDQEGMPISR
jgi:hypothetical protein